jgi:Uma2 family endonuclease
VVFASWQRLADIRRLRLVPDAGGRPDRFIELEGGPDLVVEVVSDSSVAKDTRRLPPAYFAAGVEEFWLVDARGANVRFAIHRRRAAEFEPVPADADGCQASAVLARRFRLARNRGPLNHWVYDLQVAALAP